MIIRRQWVIWHSSNSLKTNAFYVVDGCVAIGLGVCKRARCNNGLMHMLVC